MTVTTAWVSELRDALGADSVLTDPDAATTTPGPENGPESDRAGETELLGLARDADE